MFCASLTITSNYIENQVLTSKSEKVGYKITILFRYIFTIIVFFIVGFCKTTGNTLSWKKWLFPLILMINVLVMSSANSDIKKIASLEQLIIF